MDKVMVLETAFNTIDYSREWACDYENNGYYHYIDGVIDMSKNLLNKINEQNEKEITNAD